MTASGAQASAPAQAAQPLSPALRLLLLAGALLALAGYVGPWVDHRAAGLAILGLDLGEYVKFLPQVRGGAISLWREGFYLPLVAASLALSLCSWRAELRWPHLPATGALVKGALVKGALVKGALGKGALVDGLLLALQLALAIAAALNLLPPAWAPARLLTPEFQQQTAAIVLCLAAVALSPLLALLPRRLAGGAVLLLCAAAAVVPVVQFLRVLPEIAALYRHPLAPGWGMVAMLGGLALLIALGGRLLWPAPTRAAADRQ